MTESALEGGTGNKFLAATEACLYQKPLIFLNDANKNDKFVR